MEGGIDIVVSPTKQRYSELFFCGAVLIVNVQDSQGLE